MAKEFGNVEFPELPVFQVSTARPWPDGTVLLGGALHGERVVMDGQKVGERTVMVNVLKHVAGGKSFVALRKKDGGLAWSYVIDFPQMQVIEIERMDTGESVALLRRTKRTWRPRVDDDLMKSRWNQAARGVYPLLLLVLDAEGKELAMAGILSVGGSSWRYQAALEVIGTRIYVGANTPGGVRIYDAPLGEPKHDRRAYSALLQFELHHHEEIAK